MKHYGDITKINGAEVEPVWIMVGGSPCQDLSVAGKRKGLQHSDLGDGETTRSGLFMEQIRIIKEMRENDKANGRTGKLVRPRFMVWENVPGAFSSNKGEDFRAVLEETAKIIDKDALIPLPPERKWTPSGCIMGDGWSIAWRVHDAQFWRVPQRRKRIALVADFGGKCAPEILFERKSLSGDSEPSREERKETPRTSERNIDETISFGFDAYNQESTGNVSKTLTASKSDSDHIPCVYAVDQGGGKSSANVLENKSPTLTTTHQGEPAICYTQDSYDKITENEKTVSLRASGGNYGGQRSISDTIGALCARDYKGVGNQYVNEGKCVIQFNNRNDTKD